MNDTRNVGLDVHKATISVASAKWDRSEAEPLGSMADDQQAAVKLVRRLGRPAEPLGETWAAFLQPGR